MHIFTIVFLFQYLPIFLFMRRLKKTRLYFTVFHSISQYFHVCVFISVFADISVHAAAEENQAALDDGDAGQYFT